MECSCLVDVDTSEVSQESFKAFRVISKTTHKCFECGRKIPPGEEYLVEAVKWELNNGETERDRFKTCDDCKSLRDTLCCSWSYGSVLDDIFYALEDIPDDLFPWLSFAKLTPAARDYIFNIIEGWWEEQEE